MTNDKPIEIELCFTIPAGALEYETKETLAVSPANISKDRVEGYDVEATELWIDAPDKNNQMVRVNVLDNLGKEVIEEALFNQLNQ